MKSRQTGLLLLAAVLGSMPARLPAQAAPSERCEAVQGEDAHAWLGRAMSFAGIDGGGGDPLHLTFTNAVTQDYQSERSYPPFFAFFVSGDLWVVPASGVERTSQSFLTPFGRSPSSVSLSSARSTWLQRGDSLVAAPQNHPFTSQSRGLDAWAVLSDWWNARDVRVAGRCFYRDYWRTTLERDGLYGRERLYLQMQTGLPVKLERYEYDPFALWGLQRVEYVYSIWFDMPGNRLYPTTTFRLADGAIQTTRTSAPLPPDTLPLLTFALPAGAPDMSASLSDGPTDAPPDTVRVGDHTFLLHAPYYTNAITLARDTVFILDAQYPGDVRARADSTWIAKLLPGQHPVVLVVSDLAWPHIAGVRFWVARGATVVSHRSSEAFLRRVVDHRWVEPDALERARGRVSMHFVPVDTALSLGGGAVRVRAIDGMGSETALMTYLPGDAFLFAGDFIQTVAAPSTYATEVWNAVRRAGFLPRRTAAMHLPLTEWSVVDSLVESSGGRQH